MKTHETFITLEFECNIQNSNDHYRYLNGEIDYWRPKYKQENENDNIQ
jgi:hypothetical protein